MDWNRGYTATYYMTLVDSNTWRDRERFEIKSGTISIEPSNLRTSANLTVVNYDTTNEQLIRVWLDVTQYGADGDHIPLFTGYTSSPDRNLVGMRQEQNLECYSILLPAADILLPRGWYAPVETDGVSIIKSLLIPTKAPADFSPKVDKNRILTQSIIAEENESNLTMIEKVLQAMNWRLIVHGDGSIYVGPYDDTPVVTFDSIINDIVEPNVNISYNWFDCPNVIRVVLDDQVATSFDYDSDTPMSINNRGRQVWYEESTVALNDGETLQEYADRRLKELQRVSKILKYDRRYMPDVYPSDVILLNYPAQDLVGNYVVSSQSITLGFGAKTSEEVIKL